MRAENILNEGLKLLVKKGDDYTTDRLKNQHENFERVAVIASWFTADRDKPYAVLVATKLVRLAALLSTDKPPQNESLLDTFIDMANYSALWGSARQPPTIKELEAILAEPNPERNTNCYFCYKPVMQQTKIISGKYRQAHTSCYINGPEETRFTFEQLMPTEKF